MDIYERELLYVNILLLNCVYEIMNGNNFLIIVKFAIWNLVEKFNKLVRKLHINLY